jgi:hypothetical protein
MIQDTALTFPQLASYIFDTGNHSLRVEHYAEMMHLKPVYDDQSPHDCGGKCHKFEWPVMRGLAIPANAEESTEVMSSKILHNRYQKHHIIWHSLEDGGFTLGNEDDIAVSTIDIIDSMRSLDGCGQHNRTVLSPFTDLPNKFKGNEKQAWYIEKILTEMMSIDGPRGSYINFFAYPQGRLSERFMKEGYFDAIYARMADAFRIVWEKGSGVPGTANR